MVTALLLMQQRKPKTVGWRLLPQTRPKEKTAIRQIATTRKMAAEDRRKTRLETK